MPSITINFTAAQGQRISDALTRMLFLEVPATIDDFKAYVIADVKQLVRTSERRAAEEAVTVGIQDLDLT